LFDFHHHHHGKFGIFNMTQNENPAEEYFSIGIHPKDIDDNFENHYQRIKEISSLKNCLAIGECGLDGLINVDEKLQEFVFEKQILLANEIRKPVIIHCVRRFSEILKFKKTADIPMVIHGFNKKQSIASEMYTHGFYLSFGKAVLQNVSLQQIIKDFPLEKLFLETDDADFDIQTLYQKVSELKNISVENLHSQILQNLEKIITI